MCGFCIGILDLNLNVDIKILNSLNERQCVYFNQRFVRTPLGLGENCNIYYSSLVIQPQSVNMKCPLGLNAHILLSPYEFI